MLDLITGDCSLAKLASNIDLHSYRSGSRIACAGVEARSKVRKEAPVCILYFIIHNIITFVTVNLPFFCHWNDRVKSCKV